MSPRGGSSTLPRTVNNSNSNFSGPSSMPSPSALHRNNNNNFRRNSAGGNNNNNNSSGNDSPSLSRGRRQQMTTTRPYTNVRSLSSSNNRTSPSPVRRSTGQSSSLMTTSMVVDGYRVALPKTLYADDNNSDSDVAYNNMSASMDHGQMMSRRFKGAIMTESCDPSMLRSLQKTSEAWAANNEVAPSSLSTTTTVSATNRPSSLFEEGGLSLQELSDGEMSQSRLYANSSSTSSRLRPPQSAATAAFRLNPVPESLNSPDIPTSSSVAQAQPRRDDPLLYMSTSMHLQQQQKKPPVTQPQPADQKQTPSKQQQLQQQQSQQQQQQQLKQQQHLQQQQQQQQKPSSIPAMSRSLHIVPRDNNGYTSSSDQDSLLNNRRKPSMPNKQVTELRKTSGGGETKRLHKMSKSAADFDYGFDDDETDSDRDNVVVVRNKNGNNSSRSSRKSTPTSSSSAKRNNNILTNPDPRPIYSSASLTRSQSVRITSKENNSSRNSPRGYIPERYSSSSPKSNNKQQQQQQVVGSPRRPGSAPNAGLPVLTPRRVQQGASNTLPSRLASSSATTNNNSNGNVAAATSIQKQWRGHQTRNHDDKVQHLKQEIRSIRTEEHIKHLTKELQAAKQALEQERKLRALQMDAIKVLWKEVQMMDAAKNNEGEGGGRTNSAGNSGGGGGARPSGSFGSKISSRSSEHSIAKLMETLEATTAATTSSGKGISGSSLLDDDDGDISNNHPAIAGELSAVSKLNETCSSLQAQVEQLQSSLSGVLRFVESVQNNQLSGVEGDNNRTRHSSSTSTTVSSFQFQEGVSGGPASLPPSMFNSMVDNSGNNMYSSLQIHNVYDDDDNNDEESKTASSPRPSTLPGLNDEKSSSVKKKKLLDEVREESKSPPAPAEVKDFAKTLVEGLLNDALCKTPVAEKGGAVVVVVDQLERVKSGSPPEEFSCSSSGQVESDSLEEEGTPKKKRSPEKKKE